MTTCVTIVNASYGSLLLIRAIHIGCETWPILLCAHILNLHTYLCLLKHISYTGLRNIKAGIPMYVQTINIPPPWPAVYASRCTRFVLCFVYRGPLDFSHTLQGTTALGDTEFTLTDGKKHYMTALRNDYKVASDQKWKLCAYLMGYDMIDTRISGITVNLTIRNSILKPRTIDWTVPPYVWRAWTNQGTVDTNILALLVTPLTI